MSLPLQILCLADSSAYSALAQVLHSDSTVVCEQITTVTALQSALFRPWSAVIVMATTDAIDPLAALHLVRAVSDVPFLVVADRLSAATVALIKAGADNYLELNQLAQVPTAIDRAICARTQLAMQLQRKQLVQQRYHLRYQKQCLTQQRYRLRYQKQYLTQQRQDLDYLRQQAQPQVDFGLNLASAATVAEAAPSLLHQLCHSFEWDVGELWVATAQSLQPIAQQCGSVEANFAIPLTPSNAIIPCAIARTQLLEPITTRLELAAEAGLRSVWSFPIRSGVECLGVLILYSHRVQQPQLNLLKLMPLLTAQLGQLLKRQQSEMALVAKDLNNHQALDRLKNEFISIISHELRTPIAALQGSIELLLSGQLGDLSERGQRLLDIAARNSERLVRLTNSIFDLELLDSNRISLYPQQCHIVDLIKEATIAVQPIAAQARIDLQLDLQPGQIFADPARITQVLTNLLNNAIKFSTAGARIWLTVEQRSALAIPVSTSAVPPAAASYVVIHIKDEGQGIPADQLETIFHHFQQADASDSRRQGGAGLGLAICRSIVRQHQGYLWAESALGRGSTFYLALPAAASVKQVENTGENNGVRNLLEIARGS